MAWRGFNGLMQACGRARLAALVFCALTGACSFGPTGHPRDTSPIPQDAEHLKECSWFGTWGCAMNSLFFGDAGFERRSACMAYIAPSGTRVEQCGSVPADRPSP